MGNHSAPDVYSNLHRLSRMMDEALGSEWTRPQLESSMPSCPTCGAALSASSAACDYAVPLDRAPGIGDPGSIATGKLSHEDHELSIARWRVHHPGERGTSPAVIAWARERLARAGHVVPEG